MLETGLDIGALDASLLISCFWIVLLDAKVVLLHFFMYCRPPNAVYKVQRCTHRSIAYRYVKGIVLISITGKQEIGKALKFNV